MNRRRLISLLGLAPVAAPLAVKAMADSATANLAGMALGAGQGQYSNGLPPVSGGSEASKDQARLALMNPAVRAEIESMIYERERRIGFIDPDIACHRSFSLNAKIVFQRRRNVARELDQMKSEYPWSRMQKLLRGGLSLLG